MRYSLLPSLLVAGALACGTVACERDARRTDPPADDRARPAPAPPADTAREPSRTPGDAARDAGRDASGAVGTAGSRAAGATETIDVKSALMLDDGVDASGINVDTDGARKIVVLKGTVSSTAQRTRAEQIASREAPGYRVDNQLVVRAR